MSTTIEVLRESLPWVYASVLNWYNVNRFLNDILLIVWILRGVNPDWFREPSTASCGYLIDV